MNQTTTVVPVAQTATPSSYTDYFINQIQSIHSDHTVRKVIETVVIPLSILATAGLQPYLILDPMTSLVAPYSAISTYLCALATIFY